jgi:hypothetical protein
MNEITIVPVGGLANRLRVVMSGIVLAQATDARLRIVWFQDHALHAPFGGLFEPIAVPHVVLREARGWGDLLLDRPRRKNLCLPRLYQMVAFRSCLYERTVGNLQKGYFDFHAWVEKNKRVYLASFVDFMPFTSEEFNRVLVPCEALAERVNERVAHFAPHTIGVHVRRTDNAVSISKSPIELFFRQLDEAIAEDGSVAIYLATDSEEVKREMRRRYGSRVLTADNRADRSSLAGIQEGLVDLYTLARTHRILGSFGSSFSEMAAFIGQTPLKLLKR